MTPSRVWLDDEGEGGFAVPQGKGERLIICHVGGRSGFVVGAKLIFRGSKALKDSDYHTEMNASVFMDWMKRRVFPAVPRRSVIVIDRATYHTTLTDATKPARSTFKKILPVGHPELNPIEMAWGYVKAYVAKRNNTFSLAEVERLAHEALDTFDASQWARYEDHCIKVEQMFITHADEAALDMGD
ncbi:TPA: hypothetical protein N0F65_010097 [Lagenidium giganteum]|uniref:Tc1-like transposase DDE domain-containing protein n=1 Tax=Lagenidium giganteum TaxID=4803 RepID=A0AAV2YHM7_9STRA|nr:TPA: hypothetical protein N0F65_010097 [Lagenidium giganteum]